MTRDLSKITTPELADQAILETQDAIAKAEEALRKGEPAASAEMVQKLRDELAALEHLKAQKGW